MRAGGVKVGRTLGWAFALVVLGTVLLAALAPGALIGMFVMFLFVALWLWAVVSSPAAWGENRVYAATLFDGLVPYTAVEASRRWHPVLGGRGWGGWDCTYAIVTLAAHSPHVPPTRDARDDLGWQFAFGGDWTPTPFPSLGDTTRDAVGTCCEDWAPNVARRIDAALAGPGSWFWTDGAGEQVHVYSVPEGIAARIRYGD